MFVRLENENRFVKNLNNNALINSDISSMREYKSKKEVSYDFLPIDVISKYSNDKENVFLSIYKKVVKPYKLQYIPIIKDKPDGYD